MKKILAVLALIAASITMAFAQDAKAEAKLTETEVAGPNIEFETTTIDYGTIAQGADPYRVFKFKNTGTEPLVIKHAKGSCGCTVAEWPKEPILPGEAGEIRVRYETKRIGKFTKTVTLTTNAADERQTLVIKGEVQKEAPQPSGLPQKEGNPFNGGNN
jgi:hypothetical protein